MLNVETQLSAQYAFGIFLILAVQSTGNFHKIKMYSVKGMACWLRITFDFESCRDISLTLVYMVLTCKKFTVLQLANSIFFHTL